MIHKKPRRLIRRTSALMAMGISSIVLMTYLSSCSALNTVETFVFSNATNYLESQSSPLNPTFSNSPLDNYALSTSLGLLTYETTGQFKFNDKGERIESTKETLKLEAATKLEAYSTTIDSNNQKIDTLIGTIEKGTDVLANEKYNDIVSKANKFVFTINTNICWVDSNGQVQQKLSGKDFERGLETYILGSAIGYQRNGYFINQIGLDVKDTVGYDNMPSITDPSYDINNFRNTDDKFTLYLNQPYPYILSILSKTYFSPVPYTNEYVKNIKINDNKRPIAWTQNGSKITMDASNTDFKNIYGSGSPTDVLNNSWFAGPYYFSTFTNSQILAIMNEKYFDATQGYWDPSNGQKIKRYILNYGSGNAEVFYNRFIANQESWINVVPESKRTEAVLNYTNEVYETGVSQINQSNYIAYTPRPYIVNGQDLVPNNNVSDGAAKIIYNSNSKESIVFRAALSGLINHYALSKLNLPSSGDFQLSSVPYGVFHFGDDIANKIGNNNEYYKAISDDKLTGGLPRTYSDYKNGDVDQNFLFKDDKSSFTIPYYSYINNNYQQENLTINKSEFIKTLKAAGATNNQPIKFQYKYSESTVSTEYKNYLNALARAIEALGTNGNEKLISFELVPRGGTNPSATDWFNSQASSLGYSLWSPDYNAVGTWLEASSLLNSDGSPSTNIYSSFPNVFKTLVIALKDLNATYNSSTNQFAIPESVDPTPTPPSNSENDESIFYSQFTTKKTSLKNKIGDAQTSIFNNDPWVPAEIWPNKTYSEKGMEFVNFLLKNNIFDGNNINNLLQNANELSKLDQELLNQKYVAPQSVQDLIPWSKYFKSKNNNSNETNADSYGNFLGIFAGESDQNAIWLTQTIDRAFNYVPRTENGLNEAVLNLVNQHFKVRVSGVTAINIRDFEYLA